MSALVVTGHPRTGSLTGRAARAAADRYGADLLDLYAEKFDPALTEADEPDWHDPGKSYSAEVHAHMERIEAATEIAVVFPVWWFSPPAIVKGWIDRVWNHGFAYGADRPRLAGKRMLWLGLAGGPEGYFTANGFHTAMDRQLRIGVSRFCGIPDAALHLVYDTEHRSGDDVLAEAAAALDGLLAG
ncbi:putative NADPH-quinone reductase [Stackebrandtia albiflava]|uniref:Putative NADPH-quinone reductase n=1 Tax=Stackebrandtia albiflava TaxID=406432 RepID=A0A562V2F8_9ACTN|nr:NAD(P)H oxidoreductase [Stackebrandtia albiflava]TWJ11997.1 putative NADPH-quinone reductase [Stackebrandtia albiflava]